MKRRTVFAWPLIAAAIPSLQADAAHGDSRLEKLFTTFIAPCCWRANLLVHQSPQADELRQEIQKLVQAGKSDEEIKATFVSQYSMRILAMPEGARGRWLSWAPLLAVGGGFGAVAVAIQRMRTPAPPVPSASLPPLPELD